MNTVSNAVVAKIPLTENTEILLKKILKWLREIQTHKGMTSEIVSDTQLNISIDSDLKDIIENCDILISFVVGVLDNGYYVESQKMVLNDVRNKYVIACKKKTV